MNKLLYLHRFLSLLSGALILPFAALAQTGGVGIGTVTPNTRLEVNGGFSLTETTSPALTGANPAYSIPTNVSQIRLVPGSTAPTGTVALNSIRPLAASTSRFITAPPFPPRSATKSCRPEAPSPLCTAMAAGGPPAPAGQPGLMGLLVPAGLPVQPGLMGLLVPAGLPVLLGLLALPELPAPSALPGPWVRPAAMPRLLRAPA